MNRKDEIQEQLSVIRKQMGELAEQSVALENELERIKVPEMREIVKRMPWICRLNKSMDINSAVIFDSKCRGYEPEELFALREWEHESFWLENYTVKLLFSDGGVSLWFDSLDVAIDYVRQWSLDIDWQMLRTVRDTYARWVAWIDRLLGDGNGDSD